MYGGRWEKSKPNFTSEYIQDCFTRDAGKLWNQAPKEKREALSKGIAKTQIKNYCKTLPI